MDRQLAINHFHQSGLYFPFASVTLSRKALPQGDRFLHATVALWSSNPFDRHHCNNKATTTTATTTTYERNDPYRSIAVVGGRLFYGPTTSVIILDYSLETSEMIWRDGPSLNEQREELVVKLCNDYVYAIGGYNRHDRTLDTMERIHTSDLLLKRSTYTKNNPNSKQSSNKWETLQVRLSEPRRKCAAVTVQNRFLVIIGGKNETRCALSSVDIVDTMSPTSFTTADPKSRQDSPNTTSCITVIPGPELLSARWSFGAVYSSSTDQIWAVAGVGEHDCVLNTIETFHFQEFLEDCKINDTPSKDPYPVPSVFCCWCLREDSLLLSTARYGHSICELGQCLAVLGGFDGNHQSLSSMEVLDPYRPNRATSWRIPDVMKINGYCCSMLNHDEDELLIFGRYDTKNGTMDYIETLPYLHLNIASLQPGLGEENFLLHSCSKGQKEEVQNKKVPLDLACDSSNIMVQHSTANHVHHAYHSLLYYYLFEKAGHVEACWYHQQEGR